MKRYITIGLLIFAFSSIINAQIIKIGGLHWNEQYITANIISIKESTFKAIKRFGDIKKKKLIETNYFIHDSVDHVYLHIENENCFSEIYDKNGNQTESVSVIQDSYERYNYKYDEKGNIIEEKMISPFGITINKFYYIYQYDNKNNLIEEDEYNYLDSNFASRTINTYNMNNVLIVRKLFMGKDSLPNNIVKFDTLGRFIELNSFDGQRIMMSKSVKYDEKGYLIEECNFCNTLLYAQKIIYKVDELGNRIEVNELKPDGSLLNKTIFQYEFDKNNNWIRRITYTNNKINAITEREIEYY